MTVIELAKLLGRHIAQGHGDYEVSVFQWEHGQEKLDAVEIRPGGQLEFYSGTARPEPVDDLDGLI